MDRKSIETGLSDKQLSAVADLAKTNVYARQSKWKTFRELPNKDKLPFFVQHFLVGTVAVVAAGALVLQNTKVGAHELWGGVPARFIKHTRPNQAESFAQHYVEYSKWYLEEDARH